MGIDGVRKSSPAPPPASPGELSRSAPADQTGRAFDLQITSQPPGMSAVGPVEGPASPLAELRAGTVDLSGYLNLKVDEATAHLVGLPAADLLAIRTMIRERLATDPTLIDLVQTASGGVPQLSDDD